MVLADTSIWVEHLRHGRTRMVDFLEAGEVFCHPMVIGELACGSLHRRGELLRMLHELQQAMVADSQEVLVLMERHKLYGKGLGWVDVNLLASCMLSGLSLWTQDRRLARAADALGCRAMIHS